MTQLRDHNLTCINNHNALNENQFPIDAIRARTFAQRDELSPNIDFVLLILFVVIWFEMLNQKAIDLNLCHLFSLRVIFQFGNGQLFLLVSDSCDSRMEFWCFAIASLAYSKIDR